MGDEAAHEGEGGTGMRAIYIFKYLARGCLLLNYTVFFPKERETLVSSSITPAGRVALFVGFIDGRAACRPVQIAGPSLDGGRPPAEPWLIRTFHGIVWQRPRCKRHREDRDVHPMLCRLLEFTQAKLLQHITDGVGRDGMRRE